MAGNRGGLDVWLYGHRIARLSEPSAYRYRLDFTNEALDVFGAGARVLSLSIPFDTKPVVDSRDSTDRRVSALLEGLLPEGNVRRHLATDAGVASIDKMALLRRVGAECAGAVQFLPEGTTPGDGHVRPLSASEVDRLIADLPTFHLPDGARLQASLAGLQDKVLLTSRLDGSWGWPEAGAASTHIIKPEPLGPGVVVDHLIPTEDWAMRVARAAGLSASETRLDAFNGRAALVVTRYDRTPGGGRLHQEDFCQALGLDPDAKYESTREFEQRGSRLTRLARLAADRALDPEAFRVGLLSAVTFNVVIGNGDAHSKNYSLLIGERGEVTLAPLYDAAPVMYLEPRFKGTGHVINGRTNIDWVDQSDLTNEAHGWGLSERRAAIVVREVMEAVHEAVRVEPLPDRAEHVLDRLNALWTRRNWAVP